MELPAYLAEEAVARLHADHSPAKLRRILALLDLDLVEPGPEPDFDDLSRKARIEVPENEHRGCVMISGELELLGHRVPVHLRYAYAGELDESGFFGSVARLDLLIWSADDRTPGWTKIDAGILSRAMLDEIDERVLAQVWEKSNSYLG